MKKEKTKQINSWEELKSFVESVNPFVKTIILTGFVNEVYGDKTSIKTLIFSTKPICILRGNGNNNSFKEKQGKKITAISGK